MPKKKKPEPVVLEHVNGSLEFTGEKAQLNLANDTILVRAGESPEDAAARKEDEKPAIERERDAAGPAVKLS